ncbi:MAG: hypothetical protein FJ096_12170 [Deltaproteobacteria bacterium]|nr:hypothetical protein [Deltaproteobacteria bacterium]
MRTVAATLLILATLDVTTAFGQEAAGDSRGAADGKPAKSKGVPKDPDNVKGISQYEATLGRGKDRAAEKDWAAAALAFQEAIDLKPEEARGYLLLAQAKRDGDVLDIVEKGRSKSGSEATEAGLMLYRAELLERKASATALTGTGNELAAQLKAAWEPPRDAWGAYANFVASHPSVSGHKATADARRKAIAEREERESRFAAVRAKRDNK